jgi:hypothetical protein
MVEVTIDADKEHFPRVIQIPREADVPERSGRSLSPIQEHLQSANQTLW